MSGFDSGKLLGLIAISIVLSSGFVVVFKVEAVLGSGESVKIMPLGDSITRGVPPFDDPSGYRQKLYVDLIDAGFDVDFVGSLSDGSSAIPPFFDTDHEGHGGATASWFNSRLDGPTDYFLSGNPPDIILYHLGTNDLVGTDIVQYALDANESLRIIFEFDPEIIVILAKITLSTDSDFNIRVHDYNVLLEEHAQFWSDLGYSIIVVDMETALDYPGDLADFVHPNAAGYAKMAEVWYNALCDILPGGALTNGAISIAFDDNTQDQYEYAFPLLQARGMKATFYVVTDHIDDPYMSVAELQTLQDYGCEIGSHSKTHSAFTSLSDSEIREECEISKQTLQSHGLSVDNFAYPYGDRNDYTDSIVAEYYRSARSAYVEPYTMQFPVSQFVLPGFPGETGDSNALPLLQSMVDEVYSTDGWAIIFFHHVIPDVSGNPYAISSQEFESFLDYIIYKGVATITVNQGLDLTSPPSPPPSVTISPTSVRMYLGQSQTFSSSVTEGNPPFSYQWCLNDTAVSGATDSTWAFTPATTGHYKVYLNVTDALDFKVQSNIVADITVYPQLTVSISPVSVNMTVGSSQTFSSTVSGGAPPYSYQWYRNDTAVPDATSNSWAFMPASAGTYKIHLRVADSNTAVVNSNTATARVETPMTVTITPTQVKMYVGQSQTFSSSVSGGTPAFSYQWCLNDTAVPGATDSTWAFTPRTTGRYVVYLNVTDGFGFRAKSNVVDVSVSSVYLLLTADPNQGPYSKGQLITFTVNVFNGLNSTLESTLTLTVTGPRSYGFYDFQPINVAAGAVRECSFIWATPDVAGTYVADVELAPALLTAYDAVWLDAA